MKILYVASDVSVSSAHGGAVHVREVASGLTKLGHAVRVVTKGRRGEGACGKENGFEIRRTLFRVPGRWLRLLALRAVVAEARQLRPDVIIERYYNFGGEGVIAGKRYGIPVVLEVNSPMVEYAGSPKERLDRWLGSPLRRWREWITRGSAAFVTPTPAILPPGVPAEKIHVLPWGANTDLFRPEVEPARIPVAEGRRVVAFVSSFRPWHGADVLIDVAHRLREGGSPPFLFLMIGDGPTRSEVQRRATADGLEGNFFFAGSIPYVQVPSFLRLASVGVAPFETSRHRYLEIDFYWCPLKILEYMSMGLPVVTIDVPALRQIVRPDTDGILYAEGDNAALALALKRLIESPDAARGMGSAARERVVAKFSWARHCEDLAGILEPLRGSCARSA